MVIHAGELFLHIVGGFFRDIEINSAVFGAAALAHLGIDRACHHVAGGQIQLFRIVLLHESLAQVVAKNASLAANRLGDQNSLHARRPHHTGGMKLHKFHIHQLSPGAVGERHSVAGVFP